MIKQMYVIFDSKTQAYNMPFYLTNDAELHRTAINLMNDGTTEISRHPHDYSVHHIGEFNDATGKVTNADMLTCIIQFHEITEA